MNELEKAKNNLFNDIDFGKLIVELKEEIELHQVYVATMAKKGFHSFAMEAKYQDVFYEAEMVMYTINAILNSLPLDGNTLPQYVAALNMTHKLFSGNLDDKQKVLVGGIYRFLSECFIGVAHKRKQKED